MSSSELDLSVDLQLRDHGGSLEVMEMESSSCQTLLQPASASSSKADFKPKGILKNSKTSENFRLGHEILKLTSDTWSLRSNLRKLFAFSMHWLHFFVQGYSWQESKHSHGCSFSCWTWTKLLGIPPFSWYLHFSYISKMFIFAFSLYFLRLYYLKRQSWGIYHRSVTELNMHPHI